MLPAGWKATGIQVESGQAQLYQVLRDGDGEALYALKRLKNPRRAARFAREAQTMIALHRRGISVPEVVAHDLEEDRPWFAMRWFPDGSLEEALSDRRFVEDSIAGLQTLQHLASTLSDVHASEIAHRDLKPGNVLVEQDSVVLTDFGLCLEIPEDGVEADRLTETAEAVGSRYYIAPENEGGFNDAQDQRPADFYAFGKLMSALLAGRPPLPREDDLIDANGLGIAVDVRLAPLDLLLRDLLNRDPRARLQDWETVLDDLRTVEAEMGGRQRARPRAVKRDVLRAARRVRTAPGLTRQLEDAAMEQRQQAWYGDLVDALARQARASAGSLEPLQSELAGLLELYSTSGSAIAPSLLDSAGVEAPPGILPGVDGTRVATAFVIHSPRGLVALPTLMIRVWPVHNSSEVRFIRAPTLARLGEPESVPKFLIDAIHHVVGPFPAYRETTVERGLEFIDETARLFIALVESYVEALDDDEDPGVASTWTKRTVEPVDVEELGDSSDYGDMIAPDLVTFALEPAAGTDPNTPTITVISKIRDERSGIGDGQGSSPSQARLRSPSGQLRDALFTSATRIEGDERDGTYSSSFTLDEHAERGLWQVEYVMLLDNAGNRRDYSRNDLATRGFATSILVR